MQTSGVFFASGSDGYDGASLEGSLGCREADPGASSDDENFLALEILHAASFPVLGLSGDLANRFGAERNLVKEVRRMDCRFSAMKRSQTI